MDPKNGVELGVPFNLATLGKARILARYQTHHVTYQLKISSMKLWLAHELQMPNEGINHGNLNFFG